MTQARKDIIYLLLRGHYLRPWKNGHGTDCFRLYDPSGNPVKNVRHATVAKLDKYIDPSIKIWDKDKKKGTWKLRRSMVRKLHGKNMIKQLYKKQLSSSGSPRKKLAVI